MPTKETNKLDGVSSEAAKKATGHDWAEWKSILDKAGAKKWNHKEIVAYLKDHYKLSGWWQQTVTVAYEKAEGRRVVGQTADTGFQVGVQKMFPLGIDQAWSLLSSREGIACWLGKASHFALTEGKTYKTESGVEGTFLNMPVGSLHCFKNESGKSERLLISAAPAGLEEMFFEVGTPLADDATTAPPPHQADIEKLLEAAPRYGVEIKVPHE